jgi:hypothetical protein
LFEKVSSNFAVPSTVLTKYQLTLLVVLFDRKVVIRNLKQFQGTQAYLSRTSCYKHVTNMLKRLMGTSASGGRHPATTSLPLKAGPPAPPDPNQLAPSEASQHADQVIFLSFFLESAK